GLGRQLSGTLELELSTATRAEVPFTLGFQAEIPDSVVFQAFLPDVLDRNLSAGQIGVYRHCIPQFQVYIDVDCSRQIDIAVQIQSKFTCRLELRQIAKQRHSQQRKLPYQFRPAISLPKPYVYVGACLVRGGYRGFLSGSYQLADFLHDLG